MDTQFTNWFNEQDKKVLPFWSEVQYLSAEMPGHKSPFFARVDMGEEESTISISNFVALWTESLTKAEFEGRLKNQNKNLETDMSAMVKEVREVVLGRRRQSQVTVDRPTNDNRPLKITFRTKFDGLPLKWESVLHRATDEEFFNQLMKPLLSTVSHYQRREMALFDVLAAKDQEIEQRKLGSKKVAETTKFRFREWSVNDTRSKDLMRMQRRLVPDSLARSMVSNDLFYSICASEVYMRDHAETASDEELPAVSSTDVMEANRGTTAGNWDKDADSDSDSSEEAGEKHSKHPSPKTTAVNREPTPPPPTQLKRKKLRL